MSYIRRVAKIQDNWLGFHSSVDDVCYDASSYEGLPYSTVEVADAMLGLVKVVTMYLDTAIIKAKALSQSLKMFDDEENIFIAQELIFQDVFKYWRPRGESIQEVARALNKLILLSLHFLPFYFNRYVTNSGRSGIHFSGYEDDIGTDTVKNGDIQDEAYLEAGISEVDLTTDQEQKNVWDDFYLFTNGLSLRHIFYLIAQLPDREGKALLYRLGYINNNGSSGEKVDLRKTNGDFVRAVARLGDLKAVASDMEIVPSLSIAEVVAKVDKPPVLNSFHTVSRYDSPRTRLLELNISKQSLALLTPRQRSVLILALQIQNNCLVYSNSDIATQIGLSEDRIGELLLQIEHILSENRQVCPVTADGKRMMSNSLQLELLVEARTMTADRVAVLTPQQYALYEYLTIPNSDGTYNTLSMAVRAGMTKDFGAMKKILAVLRNGKNGYG